LAKQVEIIYIISSIITKFMFQVQAIKWFFLTFLLNLTAGINVSSVIN